MHLSEMSITLYKRKNLAGIFIYKYTGLLLYSIEPSKNAISLIIF